MAYEVEYAGLPLHDYITILNVKRTILPSRENFVKDIPSQHGNFYMGYKYAPREISLECVLKANGREEYVEALNELAFILDVKVPTKMVIGDSPDRCHYAVLDGSTDLEKLRFNAKFNLNFICYDPYIYAIEPDLFTDEPLANSAKAIEVQNEGNVEAYPKLSVSFSKTAHFLQATDKDGRTVLVGTPPSVDKTQGTFNNQVLKDGCKVLTNWNNVGTGVIDNGVVDGDITINGGGYAFTCTNYGSNSDGWHGGARRRNFNPVSDFRVEVKMEHNSKGDLNHTGAGSKPPATSGGGTGGTTGSSVQYKVTADPSLRIRASRSTTSAKVGTIPKGKIVNVSDIKSNWGKVTYNGKTGYIYMEYTKVYKPTTTQTSTKYKTTQSLNIRSGRGTKYKALVTMPKGTTVSVSDIKDNWGKVTYNRKTGYCSMKHMSKVTTPKISTFADEVNEDKESCEDRMGKIEVYGFSQNGNRIFKMTMKDTSEWYEYSEPEIQIGSKVVLDDNKTVPSPKTVKVKDEQDEKKTVSKKIDSGKFGDWNEFKGWFTIERKTENGKQKWKCKVEKIDSEGKVTRRIQTETLSDSSYPNEPLSNIVVWFGQYKDNVAVDVMNVSEIYVTDIGTPQKPKENKPLFQQGDTLIVDFANQTASLQTGINGSKVKSMMKYLDIGSEFFACPSGLSQIGIKSDDKNIDTDVSIVKRWL